MKPCEDNYEKFKKHYLDFDSNLKEFLNKKILLNEASKILKDEEASIIQASNKKNKSKIKRQIMPVPSYNLEATKKIEHFNNVIPLFPDKAKS